LEKGPSNGAVRKGRDLPLPPADACTEVKGIAKRVPYSDGFRAMEGSHAYVPGGDTSVGNKKQGENNHFLKDHSKAKKSRR